jgi:hypothetical protein
MTCRALIPITLLAVLLPAAPARADWVWPVRGDVITPYRNGDDPYAAGQHRGIDIAAEPGTAVAAATAGEVRFAGTAGSSGLTVSIRTADGHYDTSYLHLSATAVRKGQRIAAGEAIGAVGTTGVRSAERPHLHFGVRDAGSEHAYHDPLAFLPPTPAAPERPRPAPGTSPTPVPLLPAPRGAPRHAPAPRRAPGPRHAPTPRRAPGPRHAPRHAPAPRPAPAPGHAPTGRREPRPAPAPRHGIAPRHAPATRHSPSPSHAPASRLARAGHRSPGAPPQRGPLAQPRERRLARQAPARRGDSARVAPESPAASGPDAGWALACVGLLAAAAVLGLSEQGRNATRTSRRRLTAFVSPRLGGR